MDINCHIACRLTWFNLLGVRKLMHTYCWSCLTIFTRVKLVLVLFFRESNLFFPCYIYKLKSLCALCFVISFIHCVVVHKIWQIDRDACLLKEVKSSCRPFTGRVILQNWSSTFKSLRLSFLNSYSINGLKRQPKQHD